MFKNMQSHMKEQWDAYSVIFSAVQVSKQIHDEYHDTYIVMSFRKP